MNTLWLGLSQYASFLAAFLTPVTAGIVAYIAWQQYRLRQFDTRMQLYDRRVAVFESVMKYIANVVARDRCEDQEADALLRETSYAKHLFGNEIVDFIDEVIKQAIEAEMYQALVDLPKTDQETIRKYNEVKEWFFGTSFRSAKAIFYPYFDLNLKRI